MAVKFLHHSLTCFLAAEAIYQQDAVLARLVRESPFGDEVNSFVPELRLLSHMSPSAAVRQDLEKVIASADPNDIHFHEIEIKLSNTWDSFIRWLLNDMVDLTLESICEDTDMQASFSSSGKPGHLNYSVIVSGQKRGIRVTRRIDIIRDWLHPLALELAGRNVGIPWDTSLFPVRDESGRETFINHALANCRDCVYWVLFAKL